MLFWCLKIKVAIVASKEDPASMNIKNCLLENSEWEISSLFQGNETYVNSKNKEIAIITINDRKIFHEDLDEEIKKEFGTVPELALFVSRHTSKSGKPSLTTHPVGNYGKAEFGGKSRTLVKSSPKVMTQLLRNLNRHASNEKLEHQICFEVTHHGPYLEIPTVFIEIGSNDQEWVKKQPGNVIASSILDLFNSYSSEVDMPKDIPVIIGIGGGHYAPRFTDIILEKKVAFGHMIPSYHVDAGNIDGEMLEKALESTPNVEGVYIHRKGLKKPQVREYANWFEERGITSISSKELEDL